MNRKTVSSRNLIKTLAFTCKEMVQPGLDILIILFHKTIPIDIVDETRWSTRTRMPTRMLTNKNNTYLSHFQQTHLWDTLAWHYCATLWWDTLAWRSCKTLLTWHSCKTPLLDILVRHSSLTLLFDTLVRHSYLTLLWDRLTSQSYLTLL